MYTEVRFYSHPVEVIRLIALRNVNVEAYSFNMATHDYRLVVSNKDLVTVRKTLENYGLRYCLTPVVLVPQRARPGEIARYLNRMHFGSYMAENNRLVFRMSGRCNY